MNGSVFPKPRRSARPLLLRIAAGCALALLPLGCGGGGGRSPVEPAPVDSLALVSLAPPQGTVLQFEDDIVFTIRLRYTFASASAGSISANLFPVGPGTGFILTEPLLPRVAVSGRSGEADISFRAYSIDDEPVGNLLLSIGLFPGTATSTNTTLTVRYQVAS